jgi:hypothetical protein
MDSPIEPSILNAIDQGRGQRGRTNPRTWTRHRAQVLTLSHQGLVRSRIGGKLGLSEGHVGTLFEEACDAVLRGGAISDAADRVCAARWQRWCETGDTAA